MRKVLLAAGRYPTWRICLALIFSLIMLSTIAYDQETASIVGP